MASQTPSSGPCLSYLQRLGAIEAKILHSRPTQSVAQMTELTSSNQ